MLYKVEPDFKPILFLHYNYVHLSSGLKHACIQLMYITYDLMKYTCAWVQISPLTYSEFLQELKWALYADGRFYQLY